MQSSAPTRLLATQRYVPDALSEAFFTVTVPLMESAAEMVNTVDEERSHRAPFASQRGKTRSPIKEEAGSSLESLVFSQLYLSGPEPSLDLHLSTMSFPSCVELSV